MHIWSLLAELFKKISSLSELSPPSFFPTVVPPKLSLPLRFPWMCQPYSLAEESPAPCLLSLHMFCNSRHPGGSFTLPLALGSLLAVGRPFFGWQLHQTLWPSFVRFLFPEQPKCSNQAGPWKRSPLQLLLLLLQQKCFLLQHACQQPRGARS